MFDSAAIFVVAGRDSFVQTVENFPFSNCQIFPFQTVKIYADAQNGVFRLCLEFC
jgi:hypothetical protein